MKRRTLPLILFAAVALPALPAFAQATLQPAPGGSFMPPAGAPSDASVSVGQDNDTYPALTLTPDKSELIRLDQDAGSIIVGNPAHLSAILDTARTVLLVPRAPGSTYFTVLDAQRKVIMQRHVFVDAPADKYIRIRRNCSLGRNGCQPTSVYYCPDICHEVAVQQVSSGGAPTQTDVMGGPAGNGVAGTENTGLPPEPTGMMTPEETSPEPAEEESNAPVQEDTESTPQ